MARVLVAEWCSVADSERERAMARWRERSARLSAAGCHFWVYENLASPGRFLEFTEARDTDTLVAASAQTGGSLKGDSILTEVELI